MSIGIQTDLRVNLYPKSYSRSVIAMRSMTSAIKRGFTGRVSYSDKFSQMKHCGFVPVTADCDTVYCPETKKVFVGFGKAVVSNSNVLLATDTLNSCAALKLFDPTTSLQYLIHSYPATEVTDIEISLLETSLLGMSLVDAEFEMMPGWTLYEKAPSRLLEALHRINPAFVNKVVLVRDMTKHKTEGQALIVKQGKTFRYPGSLELNFNSKLSKESTLEEDGFVQVL